MKKLLLILVFTVFLLTGCVIDEKKAAILLSPQPIDQNNFSFVNQYPTFTQRQRIYYLLITKEPILSEKLRLQVVKIKKVGGYFQADMSYSMDINRGADMHFVTDYFTIHDPGVHVIRIFSLENLETPISETEFTVEER